MYYTGLHGEPALGRQIDGDTYQCVWSEKYKSSIICEANDSHVNRPDGGGKGADLMIGRLDRDLKTWTAINDFQSTSTMQGYGTLAEPCQPCNWCSGPHGCANGPYLNTTWKSCGMYEARGVLYACITLNRKGYPYTSLTTTIIESGDGGLTWCNHSHVNAAHTGCAASRNGPKGDVPYPDDIYPKNHDAIHGMSFIKFGRNNGYRELDNQNFAYAYVHDEHGLYLVRMALDKLPELEQKDAQYYPHWDSSNAGSPPADAVPIETPGNRAGNVSYIPGPNIYLAGINTLVDSSSITYEGDSHLMSAPEPWGPWHTIGEIPSQPTWNFGPDFMPSTLSGKGPWKIKELESGYYLLTTRHPDSNGYVPGTREVTLSRGDPQPPPSRLDIDLKKLPGLAWLYDGQWHITKPDKWSVVPDESGAGNNLEMQQFAGDEWKEETATYSTAGLASFNGLSAQALDKVVPNSTKQTYFVVYRHCCRNASSELGETVLSFGVSLERSGPDRFVARDGAATTSSFALDDGSYHLVILERTGSQLKVFDSNSLTADPAQGGTLAAPIVDVPITGAENPVQTILGNAQGNKANHAKFLQGTIVLAVAYSRDLSAKEIAKTIFAIRNDLLNDNVNGFANTKRRVNLPLSFHGRLPLDDQPQPLGSYAMRRLSSAYHGPIVEVLDANGLRHELRPDSNGSIAAALRIACRTQCTASRWYDQSGNGYDLTQPLTGTQPAIILDDDPKGQPALRFNGKQWMETGTQRFTFITDAASVHAVARSTGQNAGGSVLAFVGNPYSAGVGASAKEMATAELLGLNPEGALFARRDGLAQSAGKLTNAGGWFSATSVYNSYSHRMFVDGSVTVPKTENAGTFTTGMSHPLEFYAYDFLVGWDKHASDGSAADLHWKGDIGEVLLYDYALGSSSAAVLQQEDRKEIGTNEY